MINNINNNPCVYQKIEFCRSERYYGVVLVLLICLIGLLPINLFAQPLAKDKDKFLGCSTSSYIYRNLYQYWNQITPGNAGKWGSVEAVQGQYNWSNLDTIYNYAVNLNIPIKEHTLIWGNQQPAWVTSLDSSGQRAAIENWIQLVCQRYPLMSAIDVVNELFNAPPAYKDALGGDGATGWDWVITSFEMARQYSSPGVKLILNEYNILHSNTETTNYIDLITLLKDRDLIDGIGVQGHYFEFRSHIGATSNVYIYNINTIKSNLNRLADTGIPIYITEFDIDEPDDTNQLEQYQIYFPIFWSHPAVKGMTLWGYIEGDVWSAHPNTYLLRANETERPALPWMRAYIAQPPIPSPISPDAAVNIPRNPLLVWNSSESAISYHIQLATDGAFASIVVDSIVVDTLLQASPLEVNKRYFWRVSAANEHGTRGYSVTASFITGDQITAIEKHDRIPTGFKLYQNYPNPFNPTTTISFSLPRRSDVRLALVNILSQEAMILAEGIFEPGVYYVQLNASNLASGVYLYRMEAGSFISTKKLVLMK